MLIQANDVPSSPVKPQPRDRQVEPWQQICPNLFQPLRINPGHYQFSSNGCSLLIWTQTPYMAVLHVHVATKMHFWLIGWARGQRRGHHNQSLNVGTFPRNTFEQLCWQGSTCSLVRLRLALGRCDTLNNDLLSLECWANQWLIKFSPEKTKAMNLSHQTGNIPPLYLNQRKLDDVTTFKHLGLHLTENLKWNHHYQWNDITTVVQSNISLFADDTCLYMDSDDNTHNADTFNNDLLSLG